MRQTEASSRAEKTQIREQPILIFQSSFKLDLQVGLHVGERSARGHRPRKPGTGADRGPRPRPKRGPFVRTEGSPPPHGPYEARGTRVCVVNVCCEPPWLGTLFRAPSPLRVVPRPPSDGIVPPGAVSSCVVLRDVPPRDTNTLTRSTRRRTPYVPTTHLPATHSLHPFPTAS